MRKLLGILTLALALPAWAGNLHVLADAGLMLPLAELSRDYAAQSGTPLSVATEDSADAAKIQQGLEADLLLTADAPMIEELKLQGLADVFHTRPFTRTRLALVGSADIEPRTDFARHISLAAILYAQPDLPVYVSTNGYEADRATSLLGKHPYDELLAKRLVKRDREEIAQQLHAAPGFALMLATDARSDPSLKILYVFGSNACPPVDYQSIAIASNATQATQQFIAYLLSGKGQQLLSRYGFEKL